MQFSNTDNREGKTQPAAEGAPEEGTAAPGWQDRALQRSMGGARARSVERMERLVDAARELTTETASAAFTVQQVVARSGLSLKSFYRYFGGKDDLVLALIEQDSQVGVVLLDEMVDAHDDPARRAEAWVYGMTYLMAAGGAGYVSVLTREYHRLSEARPEELDRAVAPFVQLLADQLALATDAGALPAGDAGARAELVFDLVLCRIERLVLRRRPAADDQTADRNHAAEVEALAAQLWPFCWAGLQGDVAIAAARSDTRATR